MTANYTYNPTVKPTGLEYIKTTHCTEKCTWFSDSIVPSIHGQWLDQTSTLSSQTYTYDAAGRLTQVQTPPPAKAAPPASTPMTKTPTARASTTREPTAKANARPKAAPPKATPTTKRTG